jgi:hypothetical protein
MNNMLLIEDAKLSAAKEPWDYPKGRRNEDHAFTEN